MTQCDYARGQCPEEATLFYIRLTDRHNMARGYQIRCRCNQHAMADVYRHVTENEAQLELLRRKL